MSIFNIKFCDFDESFLDLSYWWLKDEEINYLTNAGKQTKEDQLKWYESIKGRRDYLIWGVLCENNPIGVCGIKNIKEKTGEYFGYIGEKQLWGRGLGKLMMKEIENWVKEQTNINVITLKVLKDNLIAISLYSRMGYILISEDERFLLMNKKIR